MTRAGLMKKLNKCTVLLVGNEGRKMKGVYERVANGENFLIDFKNRNLKVGGDYLIINGIAIDGLDITVDDEDVIGTIERLYQDYKYSVPSERNTKRSKRYFYCLKADELTDEQFSCGEDRDLAQIKLESYVLICIVNGSLQWNQPGWFWKSPREKDLILLKEWIV